MLVVCHLEGVIAFHLTSISLAKRKQRKKQTNKISTKVSVSLEGNMLLVFVVVVAVGLVCCCFDDSLFFFPFSKFCIHVPKCPLIYIYQYGY